MKYLVLAAACLIGACGAPDTNLIPDDAISGDRIPQPLTSIAGDIERGQMIFSDRDQGHCVLCHVVNGLGVPFQGDVGPDLSAVAERLDPAQLRLRIVDYQIVQPGTLMPSYYRTHDLYQVGDAYQGDPILSAQDVEDLVAYLSKLNVDANVANE